MKKKLMKKTRRVANIIALVSLVFNASMLSVFVPEVAKADAPTPATQTLISPANGAHVDYENLVFNWTEAVDVSGHNPVEYKFQISTSSAVNTAPASYFTGTIVYEKDWDEGLYDNYLDASDESMPLVEGQTYYWHVRAEDSNGGSAANRNLWSEVRSFTIDNDAPVITDVSIKSNNINHSYAKVGDTVTVSFKSDEVLYGTTAKIAGNVAVVSGTFPNYSASYIMQDTDSDTNPASSISFAIENYSDEAGNYGLAISATNDYSEVIFDKTAPTAKTYESFIDATNPTNNNNPTVSGKYTGLVENNIVAEMLPSESLPTDINSIKVVFELTSLVETSNLNTQSAGVYYTKDGDMDGLGGYTTDKDDLYVCTGCLVNTTSFKAQLITQVTSEFLPDGTYKVYAQSFDLAGNFKTELIENAQVIDTMAPAVVTNLVVTGKTDTTVSLQWDAVIDADLGGYKVLILNSNGNLVGTRDVGNVTSAVITGLNPNTNYSFKVVAYDTAMNDSVVSNTVTDTTNATPVVLAAATTTTVSSSVKALEGPAAPEGEILGDTDEKKDGATENKDEKKDENKNNGFNWWWIILLLALTGGGYYYYTKNPAFFKKFSKGPNPPSGI